MRMDQGGAERIASSERVPREARESATLTLKGLVNSVINCDKLCDIGLD